MTDDTIHQRLRATTKVELDPLGFPEGSYVKGLLNPTPAWRQAYRERVSEVGGEELMAAADDLRATSEEYQRMRQRLEDLEEQGDAKPAVIEEARQDVEETRADYEEAQQYLQEISQETERATEEASAGMLPEIFDEVVITDEAGEIIERRPIDGPEDVRYFDAVDPDILTTALNELLRRGSERLQTADATFRRKRRQRLEASKAVRAAALGVGSDQDGTA